MKNTVVIKGVETQVSEERLNAIAGEVSRNPLLKKKSRLVYDASKNKRTVVVRK